MKKIVSLLMCSLVVINLFGCADRQAYQQYNDSFTTSANGYYEAASKPLMDMKLPAPEGKEYHLVVNREVKPLVPQQIKDSEWTGAVVAGIVGATTLGLGIVKMEINESDNDRMVKMNDSDNVAQTAQLRDYVTQFNKETLIEKTTIISTEGGAATQTTLTESLNQNTLNP